MTCVNKQLALPIFQNKTKSAMLFIQSKRSRAEGNTVPRFQAIEAQLQPSV
jgi:hypothetical protein